MYKLAKKDRSARDEKRGQYDEGLRWYALMTHCGSERAVAQAIARQIQLAPDDEIILPLYLPQDKTAADSQHLLFSSYLFLRTRLCDAVYMGICALEGVFKILGEAWRIPTVVEDGEIDLLKLVLQAHERPELVPRVDKGDEVEIASGLMKGALGRVVGGNANSVKLQLRFSFLDPQSRVQITVPRSSIKLRLDEQNLRKMKK